ncbi:hypothetical protein IMZ48_26015 [Candidatus Bathyarchaeota archaeon]|nr:hypothetical protein [Candidatus Bathyarchaeota archaeon]
MSTVLSDKDVNQTVAAKEEQADNVKSMEYHRQVLQNKMDSEESVFLRSLPPLLGS